jgi:Tol biopolymer transport system component
MKLAAFDRIVLFIATGLVAAIAGLALIGDRTGIGSGINIVSVTPTDGSNPSIATPVQIEFGQAMNHQSVQARFFIQPAVTGQINWIGNSFTFKPDHLLFSQQTYSITLAQGAETASGNQTIRPFKWSFKPRSPSVVYLVGGQGQPQVVCIIALDGGETRDLLTSSSTILDFAPSPDGLKIAVTILGDGGKSDIWLIDTATGKNRQSLGCAPSSCSSPVWSPNGRLLAYQRNEPTPNHASGFDRVWLYDLASGQTQPAFEDNQVLGAQPVWSFNSRRLAFIDDNASGIRVTDLVDQQAFLVPDPLGNDTGSFSPDGNSLVFTKKTSENGQLGVHLWLAQLDKTVSVALLLNGNETYQDYLPAWSPDDQWIAFLRTGPDQPHQNQVMLYQRSTSQVIPLTGQDNYGNLVWDSNGQYLMVQRFLSDGNRTSEIWVYDFTASRIGRRLIENGTNGRWMP